MDFDGQNMAYGGQKREVPNSQAHWAANALFWDFKTSIQGSGVLFLRRSRALCFEKSGIAANREKMTEQCIVGGT